MSKIIAWLIPKGRPLRWLLPLALVAVFSLLQGIAPGWAALPEAWTIDARFALRGAEPPQNPVVIVALDEDSFQMMNALNGENIRTWPRARWAELVQKLSDLQPRVIGLDVIFDTPGWDAGGDAALAQALADAGNIVLAGHLAYTEGNQYVRRTYSPPVEPLMGAALAAAVANVPVEVDGAVRQGQVLFRVSETAQSPAFGVVVASAYTGAPLKVDIQEIGEDLRFLLRFRGPESTFRTVSLIDLWDGAVDAAIFQDAIVLVGFTTQLEQDRFPTPFGGKLRMPGVEIQATMVDNLLADDWLRQPPEGTGILLVMVFGLLAAAALNLRRSGAGIAVLLAGVLLALIAAQILFASGWLFPVAAPVIAALVTGGVTLGERVIFAEREKRLLRQRFAGMMSPERLQAVMDAWDDLRRADRPPKPAAVMFADVRGFTHATEQLMRQNRYPEMVAFLGVYLDKMAQVVFEEGGVIYRMLGDGLLVMFGMPQPLPDYPLRVVRAAVRMAQAAEELQSLWPLRDESPLGMGMGIHCGEMVDAVVGQGWRVDYAIIGDPANTAARIESHCKAVMEVPRPPGGEVPEHTTILISDALYQQVKDHVLADADVPPFAARGKAEPLKVYRLLGLQRGENP